MQTECLEVDPEHPQPDVIARAAAVIRAGGVVAFPTETVYGLGADALNAAAVRRIFAAKGRPSNNPLIVHITGIADARRLVASWPEIADRLAQAFWPGPLTMVLPKAACVPDVVTAGGPTVALRMPRHAVAQALIAAAGVPLAAPSANLSTRVSAVRAEHVLNTLSGRIEMVLDGGPTLGGLESTVVDLSRAAPRILRPGLIDAPTIATALGTDVQTFLAAAEEQDASLPSPGMLRKHYSPTVPVVLVGDGDGGVRARQLASQGHIVGWLPLQSVIARVDTVPAIVCVPMPREPAQYARRLYDTLHTLEGAGATYIVVEQPPADSAWEAVRDRLQRAAAT